MEAFAKFFSQIMQYHTMQNVLFMAKTEFLKVIHNVVNATLNLLSVTRILLQRSITCSSMLELLPNLLAYQSVLYHVTVLQLHEEPDWNFIRAKQDEIAFLFGVDDHWGPLTHMEKVNGSLVISMALF